MTDLEKTIAEIREWHEGKRPLLPLVIGESIGLLLAELDRLERELAAERAAHNAHVTELCRAEQENRKRFVQIAELVSERERLYEQWDKLIEGLRWYAKGTAFANGEKARSILKEICIEI